MSREAKILLWVKSWVGKQLDSVPNDGKKKKRQEIYKQRIERLKRNGKYEEYLAKRRKQARKLYHTVDENGNKPYREKENKRYRERILKLKETGAYRDHLDKCNARTGEEKREEKERANGY